MADDKYSDALFKVMKKRRFPTSTRELAHISYMSPITVKNRLKELKRKGYVEKVVIGKRTFWKPIYVRQTNVKLPSGKIIERRSHTRRKPIGKRKPLNVRKKKKR